MKKYELWVKGKMSALISPRSEERENGQTIYRSVVATYGVRHNALTLDMTVTWIQHDRKVLSYISV